MFIEGPEVSFKGPYSRQLQQLCEHRTLFLQNFLLNVLFGIIPSTPSIDIINAIITQQIKAPPSIPPRALGPATNPTITVRTARAPGAIIFLRAARVAISTQVAVSVLPSFQKARDLFKLAPNFFNHLESRITYSSHSK